MRLLEVCSLETGGKVGGLKGRREIDGSLPSISASLLAYRSPLFAGKAFSKSKEYREGLARPLRLISAVLSTLPSRSLPLLLCEFTYQTAQCKVVVILQLHK